MHEQGERQTPRRLLALVRDIMAGAGSAQERLNQVVRAIGGGLKAEVCSVYVRRAGDVLELFATEGLKASAVHFTRLRVGEGLVGLIAARARPMAITDAQNHPDFAFRPETGEELYHSLMGVPLMRNRRVIGVVVVQSRDKRNFAAEELEILEIVAMVMAEVVAAGDVIDRSELLPADGIAVAPMQLSGTRLVGGLGIGTAVLLQPRLTFGRMVAEDPEFEHVRLKKAVSEMHGALEDMLRSSDLGGDGEHREVLETYRLIAEDAGWLTRIDEAINSGLTAEAAVTKVQADMRARFAQISDGYLRERINDLEDLAQRLLQYLMGADSRSRVDGTAGDVVIFARNLGPAQMLEFDRRRLRAVVLEEGSLTAHVAIIARALDIPLVGQVRGVLDIVDDGDPVIVDADHANVFVRPGDSVRGVFVKSLEERARQKASLAALRDLPAVTLDGVGIALNINAGLRRDVSQIAATGADGIGLYRTEIPFMTRSEFPQVRVQESLYRNVLDSADGKPIAFRTVDIGGDKVLPYWDHARTDNPAMGWRAIRVCLDRPAILRHQVRAMIHAAEGRPLRLMFPMVATVGEFDHARALLDQELDRARAKGEPVPSDLKVGAMLEVPSLLFQFPQLLARVDFLSVGSNDLVQFFYASDRGDPGLSTRYDVLSPAFLNVLKGIVEACDAAGVPVGVCGEMAANPLDSFVLVALGYRNLSMVASAVAPVKAMIRSMDVGQAREFLDFILGSGRNKLRDEVRMFIRDHGVKI